MTTNPLVNINTADLDSLIAVQGIGPALAKRIIEQRPFAALEDLTRVPGIGKNSLTELVPYLTVSSPESEAEILAVAFNEAGALAEEDLVVDAIVESEILPDTESEVITMSTEEQRPEPIEEVFYDSPEEGTPVEIDEEAILEELGLDDETEEGEEAVEVEIIKEVKDEEKTENYVTRSQLTWTVITAVVGTILLTTVLTLGILAFINNDLRFATWNDAVHLSNQITVLNDNVSNQQTDINNLRERVDALETVAGRVTALEKVTGTMQDDIAAAQDDLLWMQDTMDEMQIQITEIQERVSEFNHAFIGIYESILPVVEPFLNQGGEN